MNIDSLRSSLNDITRGALYPDPDAEWRTSLSGRIYTRLETIAKRGGQPVSVQNKGSPVEIYTLGDESASLVKRLTDGTVGEDGGTIQTFAECWEVKRYPWWKEALTIPGMDRLPVILLDTPVVKLAVDAGINDAESYFDLAVVVAKYGWNLSGTYENGLVLQHWIKGQITGALNPQLDPNYSIEEYEQQLRLRPKNEEARASCLEDNNAYEAAKGAIQQSLPELQRRYQERSS